MQLGDVAKKHTPIIELLQVRKAQNQLQIKPNLAILPSCCYALARVIKINLNTNNMKKISTLFKKDPNDLGRVINEINPENEWVFTDGIPTRKFDGTSVAIINGEIYKRYDVKKGRQIPNGAIPCQEADLITGHHPHWLKCDRSKKEDKYFFEAYDKHEKWFDGTYELCGEKIQGNPEKIKGHSLIRHGEVVLVLEDDSFEYLKEYLSNPENDIEGIVFHHKIDGKMCKLRKSDFGVRR